MRLLRIISLCALGCLGPVFLVLALSPVLLKLPESEIAVSRAKLSFPKQFEESEELLEHSLQYVSAGVALDPVASTPFLVSVEVKLSSFPMGGKREKLVAKYSGRDKPYPGWALAFRQTDTSLRAEAYWRSKSGQGGWQTFDEVNIELGKWYTFNLLVQPNEAMSLFVSEAESSSSQYLGGFPIDTIPMPTTEANLYFGFRSNPQGETIGEIRTLLVARPQKLPTEYQDIMKQFGVASRRIAKQLSKDEVLLLVGEKGRDESKFSHQIRLI